jgi:hypothetical protein
MSNLLVRRKGISGYRVIGLMVMMGIFGCRVIGRLRRRQVFIGHRVTGVLSVVYIDGMEVTGVLM